MVHNYNYRARTEEGQVVTGIVQATSIEEAKKILGKNKMIALAISMPKGLEDYLPFYGRIGVKEKSFFVRQLATMIEAGLTLTQALRLLVRQTRQGKFRNVLEGILNDLQDGFSFPAALSKYPEIFDQIFINVVRSGEATGKLEVVLLQLADTMEKDVEVRGKIKGALFYPAFIMCAMVGVAVIMMIMVIPKLKDLFLEAKQELPVSTKLLIWLSDYMVQRWYFVLLIVVGGVVGVRYFLRSEAGIEFFSKFSLKAPVFGVINEQTNMARFGRLMGMLLSSGVPLLEALRLIDDSFTNRIYQRAVANVAVQVERGVPMSVPIAENPVFPIMLGQMVSVGEQTGKMDEVMEKMANYYQSEVDSKVSGLSSLIEPMIIIILGIGVAWLVMAILLPIYQISTSM